MANLRALLEQMDPNGSNADQPSPEGLGRMARMPVPLTHQDLGPMADPAPDPAEAARIATQRGQSTESPRERMMMTSAPRMPDVPTPQAGAAGPAMDASTGVIPFAPMTSPAPVSQVTPQAGSMFGTLGGLTGGGLGRPQDPTTRANSNSIEGLIQLLTQLHGQ